MSADPRVTAATWLSEEWVAATADVAGSALATLFRPGSTDEPGSTDRPGSTDQRGRTSVGLTVIGMPGGEIRYHRIVEDGRVTGGGPGAGAAPDVVFTATADDSRAMAKGELDPSVAFMQGRLKTAGDTGLVLAVLAGWSSPKGRKACAHLARMTVF